MPNRVAVSSAEFIRNIGYWQGEAMRQPVAITHHGRERLVLAAPELLRESPAANTDHAELDQLKTAHAALLESIEEAYLGFDHQLRITSANSMAEAFIGSSRAQLLNRTVFDALPDPLAPIAADRLQRVLKVRKPEVFECGVFDGRHVAVRVFPVPDGAAALFQNVTEQHVRRREREEMLAMQSAMRQHEHVSLITLDARARIENVDNAFSNWTGFTPDDLTGHRFTDLSPVGTRRELAEMVERVMRESRAMQMYLTLLGKRGDEICGRVAIAPIQTDFVARGAQVLWTRGADLDLDLGSTQNDVNVRRGTAI